MEKSDTETIYEVGFHIAATLPEEKLPAEVAAIKEVLDKHSVEYIAEEFPKHMPLAYTIEKKTVGGTMKHTDAYFGWIKFATGKENISLIKSELDANDNIVRHMIIVTVRENTMPVKTFNPKKQDEDGNTHKKEEITKEDEKVIDESIEELVSEE